MALPETNLTIATTYAFTIAGIVLLLQNNSFPPRVLVDSTSCVWDCSTLSSSVSQVVANSYRV